MSRDTRFPPLRGSRRGHARHPPKSALCRHLGRAGLSAAPQPHMRAPRLPAPGSAQPCCTDRRHQHHSGGGGWAWGWGTACWHPAGRSRMGWWTAGHRDPRVGGKWGGHTSTVHKFLQPHVRLCSEQDGVGAPRGMEKGHSSPGWGSPLTSGLDWAVASWPEGWVPGAVLCVSVLLYGKLFSDCE